MRTATVRAQIAVPAYGETVEGTETRTTKKASSDEAAAVDYVTSLRLAQAEEDAKQNVSAQ